MVKLYKLDDKGLQYWETFELSPKASIVHFGAVGDLGETLELIADEPIEHQIIIDKEIEEKRNEGYFEFIEDDYSYLEVEYKINGFGTKEDLEKRYKIEEYLNDVLGWTGLGDTTGGSTGSGTMEVGCMVVDSEIAMVILDNCLKRSDYSDYSRIYKLRIPK